MPFDLYQHITDEILAMLDQGVVPWRSPILGRGAATHPKNLHSRKEYRGINCFLLAFRQWVKGYDSSYWLTFNQAREKGGSVKKGEKATMVVFWKQYETTDKETGEVARLPVLRYYNVFNVDQIEGIVAPDAVPFVPLEFKPIEAAESIVKEYADGPAIEHGGSQALYRPSTDTVHMPQPTRFRSSEEYYSTLLHELSHSTGHSQRLDRKLDANLLPFGSADYGREELVAEMSAAFLCGHAGIEPKVIENQAAYLQGWLKQIKRDKRLVIVAAGAAQKSADWILGQHQNAPAEEPTPKAPLSAATKLELAYAA